MFGAVLVLTKLFNERKDILLIENSDPVLPVPTIILTRTSARATLLWPNAVIIKMDESVVVSDEQEPDISMDLECLFACYFVYGIRYPTKLQKTLSFLEHYIFGLGKGIAPAAVSRVANFIFK